MHAKEQSLVWVIYYQRKIFMKFEKSWTRRQYNVAMPMIIIIGSFSSGYEYENEIWSRARKSP
jgi:polyferredoxin